jgi:hypothetical protein
VITIRTASGRNASGTKPAKFLVLLVEDKSAPILFPVNK